MHAASRAVDCSTHISVHVCLPHGSGQRSSTGKSSLQMRHANGGGRLKTPEIAESTALAKRINVPYAALESFGTLAGRSRCSAAMDVGLGRASSAAVTGAAGALRVRRGCIATSSKSCAEREAAASRD
jgi:hypothetical protein